MFWIVVLALTFGCLYFVVFARLFWVCDVFVFVLAFLLLVFGILDFLVFAFWGFVSAIVFLLVGLCVYLWVVWCLCFVFLGVSVVFLASFGNRLLFVFDYV